MASFPAPIPGVMSSIRRPLTRVHTSLYTSDNQRRSKMGVDCGFDVYPSLSPQCQGQYEAFLEEEVIHKYKDALHPNTGEPLIQIIGTPETKNAYVFFSIGEDPVIPYRSEYFLRFQSRQEVKDGAAVDGPCLNVLMSQLMMMPRLLLAPFRAVYRSAFSLA